MSLLARRIESVKPSVTLAISAEAKKLKDAGVPVIGFGAGEPDFDTPDYIKIAAIEAIKAGFTKYTPASGTDELKEAICQKFQKDNALEYAPSQIIVSNGAKHSIYNVLQAMCEEGDEVVVIAPYWLSYPEMVALTGATTVVVETDAAQEFKVSPEQLKAALTDKTKLVILNSPSNPTGAVYSHEELAALGAVLEQSSAYILSDEIYEKIIYDQEHVSIASLSPALKEKTIVVNGHSKIYSMTGWRIGYLAAPASLAKAIGSMQSHATSNPCSIAQKAAYTALTGDQSWIPDIVVRFKERRDVMVSRLRAMKGIECVNPGGAFYVFPKISGLNRGGSLQVTEALLKEANVAVVPGEAFGADDCIRLSYATSMDNITKGLDAIERWIG